MSFPPPQTKEFADRLTSLAIECREELTQGTQSIQEIELLLRQTQQEIDRLSSRETQQNLRLREMESSIESFSRSDIREAYLSAHEVQMRLFMMRSQIEQLEARQKGIHEQQEKLRILLNLAEINRDQDMELTAEDRTKILPGTRMLADNVDFAAEIVEAKEKERERVARQLTDGPAQTMANLILRTQILDHVADKEPDRLSEEIAEFSELATRSLLDIRRSIFEMRPPVIDELGLVPTLRRYSNDFARENAASISLDGPDRDSLINGHTRIALFRLVQQGMSALVMSGAGTQLQINVNNEEAQLVVRLDASNVEDDVPIRVDRFVSDAYTAESLELIGATMQHESFSGGERLTIVVELETA